MGKYKIGNEVLGRFVLGNIVLEHPFLGINFWEKWAGTGVYDASTSFFGLFAGNGIASLRTLLDRKAWPQVGLGGIKISISIPNI